MSENWIPKVGERVTFVGAAECLVTGDQYTISGILGGWLTIGACKHGGFPTVQREGVRPLVTLGMEAAPDLERPAALIWATCTGALCKRRLINRWQYVSRATGKCAACGETCSTPNV